ncbi:unnamed protein product [Cylindrotheca closterium]|uniref:Reverse transcriptase domain-containing protein n=1 Tax=Cylindrotheca closterium TaxID=2856 RepID=A0AAD2G463_9STRA|nr:unnamed protein product [Cylindrotheca closterium]
MPSRRWISNDAKSCFDRIVHWVAIISLMRFGIQWRTLRSMFVTLMKSKHRVRTGFGDSDRVFTPPTLIPFQGCGQGNGAGPPVWVAISSILLGMMISKGFGFDFLMSISWAPLLADCFCFVDDTDVCQAAPSPDQSGESIVPAVAKALQWWSNGVRLTGGAIRPDKSFWYLIDFKHVGIAVELDDLDGTSVHLKWLEADELAKTLGILMSPCSNSKAQLVVMQGKAKAWADQIQPSFLQQYDVLPLLCTTIQKTLEYPMALTFFSPQEWDQILSPVLRASLPKAGICRNFPRAMVYAPIALQGVGVPHPYGLQVIKHLDMLLRHPANQTKTGAFLEAVLQAHQLKTGTSYGLFQQVYSNTSILASDMWAKRTWSELDSLSIHLEFDSPSLQPMRQGDQLLVDLFIDSLVDQHTLKWLNWCRIFLHAVTLSDIVNAEGTAITLDAWKGIRADYLADRYQWPRTARPSNQWWTMWQQWISTHLTGHSNRRRLSSPLGLWHSADLSWKWQYSPSTNTLFHHEGQIWIPSEPTSSTSRQRTFYLPRHFNLDLPPLPVNTVRALVSVFSSRSPSHKSRVLLHSTGPHQPAETPHQPAETPAPHLPSLIFGTNLAVWLSQVLTAGFQRNIIWITCQTPGKFEDQSSTRSELIGLMASLLVLEWMAQLAQLKLFASQPLVEMACDGLIALDKSFSEAHLSLSGAQFDLASTIRALLCHLPLQVHRHHVKGSHHGAGLSSCPSYWSSKDRLSEQSIREVDWLSLARAMKALPANLQRWTPKHISGMTGVGKFLAIWKRSATSSCPRCSSCPVEDHLHVPRCSAPTAAAEWSKRHLAFRTWMQTQQTAPEIEAFLFEYLKTVRQPTLGVPNVRAWSCQPHLFQRAISSQAKLGAQGLLEGLVSPKWRHLQALHFSYIGSKKSANLWASRLIQQLIRIGHYMWKDRNRLAHSEDSSW